MSWRRCRRWCALLAILVVGCDAVEPGERERPHAVEAYMVAEAPLPPVRVTRTVPLHDRRPGDEEVSGARVRIDLLGDDGAVEVTYAYEERDGSPGTYLPAGERVVVEPLRTYALTVDLPDGAGRLTARTVVPDTLAIVSARPSRVVFRSVDQLVLRVTQSDFPGRDQDYYVFTTEAQNASEDNLTPFTREIYENGDVTLDELRVGASPVLNEANYQVNADGTLTIRFPWLAIAFYGPNTVTINAVDDNLYDFIRTASVQQGGSPLPPGEIPNVLDPVEGGTGIFGSMASASVVVFVDPPPDAKATTPTGRARGGTGYRARWP